jgi:hypothetical protein
MRYAIFCFFLLSLFREISHQSLWESGKVPMLFADLFHFSIGSNFTDLNPQIVLKNPFFYAGIATARNAKSTRASDG